MNDETYEDRCWRSMPWELDADEVGYFYRAVLTDEHSGGVEVVSSLIASEAMELWTYNHEGTILVAVTRLVTYPDGYRELFVQMMAGTKVTSTDAHLECEKAMMKYALRQGCQRMVAGMRPEIYEGMAKHLGPRYRPEYVVLSLAPEDVLNLSEPGDGGLPEDLPDHHGPTHNDERGTEGND